MNGGGKRRRKERECGRERERERERGKGTSESDVIQAKSQFMQYKYEEIRILQARSTLIYKY